MWHVAYHIDLYSIPISASITSVARQNAAKTSEIRRKIWQNTASHNTVKSCEIPKNVWIIVSSPNHHLPPTHPQAKSWARRPGPLGSTKNPPKNPLGPRARRPLPSLSREKDRHRLEQRSMGLPLNHPSH